MKLHRPFDVVTPTVDGEVLSVVARADAWFTVPQLKNLIGNRSAEGIRQTLGRLAAEGVIDVQAAGRTSLYRLNRQHVAAEAIIHLAGLADLLLERIRNEIGQWEVPALYAALFGSGARRSMRADSDLDLFLLEPDRPSDLWDSQVDTLARHVRAWSGNDPRILQFTASSAAEGAGVEPVLQSIADEGIPLAGSKSEFRRLVGAR